MSNENKTAVKEFVQRYINSHEPDTFARNENGLMMYQLKHSGINLESFFEDIIEDFISEQNELASLQTQEKDKEIEELDKIKILYSTLVESYQEQSERIKDLEEFISVQVVNYTTSKLKAFEVKKLAISLLTPTKEERKEGECKHEEVILVRHACKCKECGTLMETTF